MNENQSNYVPKSVSPPPILGSASSFLARVSPGAAAYVAKRMFLHTFPYRVSEAEREFLKLGAPLCLYDGRCGLRGYRWGNGPAVLVVHGWSGRGVQFHRIAEGLIPKGYSVIGFDFPGHGLSKKPKPTLYDFVNSIKVISETYGPFQGVVSHSLGSLASGLAYEQGYLSCKLVCVNPLPSADYAVTTFSKMSGIPLPTMREMQRGIERDYNTKFESCDFERIAEKIDAPVLVIHDRLDRVIPWDASQKWSKLLSDGDLVTTERLGHQRILAAESVVKKIVDFFGAARGNMKEQFLSEYAL